MPSPEAESIIISFESDLKKLENYYGLDLLIQWYEHGSFKASDRIAKQVANYIRHRQDGFIFRTAFVKTPSVEWPITEKPSHKSIVKETIALFRVIRSLVNRRNQV